MREKKNCVVITFHTTAAAMETERLCRERGLPGRLIPAPRSITADCGMAWRSEPALRPQVEQAAADLPVDQFYLMEC